MLQDILACRFQVLLIGPEMFLEHAKFCGVARTSSFMETTKVVVIDEAHCIEQWAEFREKYTQLNRLRALVSPNVPFLVTSATLTPYALRCIRHKLSLDPVRTVWGTTAEISPNSYIPLNPSTIMIASVSSSSKQSAAKI